MAIRSRAAQCVRRLFRGEAMEDQIDEAKARTWREGVEHLVLQLQTCDRLLVKGGRDGVKFIVRGEGDGRTLHVRFGGRLARVVRIFGYAHPGVTGPSDGDLEALALLKQGYSFLFEIGGNRRGTRIRPGRDLAADRLRDGVLVHDAFEIKAAYHLDYPPGVVAVLDGFACRDPGRFIGRAAWIDLAPRQPIRATIADARDHGTTISFFFQGLATRDVPIGARVFLED